MALRMKGMWEGWWSRKMIGAQVSGENGVIIPALAYH